MPGRATVVVVGAGGNIGSHLVPHLARMPGIGRLVLVDRDAYEPRNFRNQDAPRRAAGRGKAAVQAERARRLHGDGQVESRREDVETMPMGGLRGDLILACLDSRRARQAVNQAAWRLGVPWIDAGVHADGLLARVTRYDPSQAAPCLECGWDDADYAALEQRYPCAGGVAAPPTAAPSSLGALAASLLALECHKHLAGAGQPLPPGVSLMVDAAHHRHSVTAARRNQACRLDHHAPWLIEPLAALRWTLASLLEAGAEGLGGPPALRLDGRAFVREMRCTGCGRARRPWRLAGRLGTRIRRCATCGAATEAAGWGQAETLVQKDLPARVLSRPLAAFGLRRGDVLSLSANGRERHFELVAS